MTDFYTLWTDTGLTKIGDAAIDVPFNLVTAVVGDGNGSEVIPNMGQTALVNQVWSGDISSKTRSTSDPNTIVFEFTIPVADGPFTIREVGLLDEDGELCIVGNWPVTEKPVAADGATRDMVLRVPVHFENAEVVSLVVDATIVTATKAELTAHAEDPHLHRGKNVLINGNFDIWQRGTNQTTAGYGSDDRWVNNYTGSTHTHSQSAFAVGQTDVPGEPTYYSTTEVTTGGATSDVVEKHQNIEDVRTFADQKATLSFYAKADASKNMAVGLIQNFGSGGSDAVYVDPETCALTTEWQKFEITFDVPSISGKTIGDGSFLEVIFWFDAGSDFDAYTNSLGNQDGTFDIARVQFEKGELATDFAWRFPAIELILCQRYYLILPSDFAFGMLSSTQTFVRRTFVIFPVAMRTAPTISCEAESYTANYHYLSEYSVELYVNIGNTTGDIILSDFVADAEL